MDQNKQAEDIVSKTKRVYVLMDQILDGKWDESLVTTRSFPSIDDGTLNIALVTLLHYKLHELGYGGKFTEALRTLRNQIAPLSTHDELWAHVKDLNSIVGSGPRLRNAALKCRLDALADLREVFLDDMMAGTLGDPLEPTLDEEVLLYTDYQCASPRYPSKTLQIIKEYIDEVLFLQFSHNGKYLAASSKDYRVLIWEVNEKTYKVSLMRVLRGHTKPVSYISWNFDDSQLLTCGKEDSVRRWNIPSGELLREYFIWNLGTISCAWCSDGANILAGLMDGSIIMWSLEGEELYRFNDKQYLTRIADLVVTDRGVMIAACADNRIVLSGDDSDIYIEEEDGDIVSFSMSEDFKFLLVCMSNAELHLWKNIELETPEITMTSEGQKLESLVVRSCFGGQDYIAGGSEDSQVYIWDAASGDQIQKLAGHSAVVNCVSSNPAVPHMLASGSDDCTIRIWV